MKRRVQQVNSAVPQRQSLVDDSGGAGIAQLALRPAGHRTGPDGWPPEHEVAQMLGISRGTLRDGAPAARGHGRDRPGKQGSGTFVGRVVVPSQLGGAPRAPRAVLLPSPNGAAVTLTAANLRIEERAVGPEVGEPLELDPSTRVTTIFRVLLASASPVAVMFDVVHPDVELPASGRLERSL